MSTTSLSRTLLVGLSLIAAVIGNDTCDDVVQLTSTDPLGPFYREESSMSNIIVSRSLLIDPANVFVVNGVVYGNDCVPLSGARVEAWYAGGGGEYSDDDYRGQVFTKECGEFQFTQTFPAVYPQRPIQHIHYRISASDDTQLLVTQLYFEGFIPSPYNPDESTIVTVVDEPDGSKSAEFHVYVSIPGNSDLDACKSGVENGETGVNSTIAFQEETMVPGELEGEGSNSTVTGIDPNEDATLIEAEEPDEEGEGDAATSVLRGDNLFD
ncbi:Inherit from opiNOG: Dioxygenase [Seminavis robusta]|uniref:Inherit from opiNOG: Dioxygenase n=1 Tax=Seminavis robusta TaxID=568900 RepID=A0A9N8E1J7_9STRA|nr:Inherit from opiNOG: Dioxygenase [Seminavis robusta]|eukprot:Sro453_g146250.1 Inherit from opiNOG: Dioxygenase (268) ;mRNA; r:60695-61609